MNEKLKTKLKKAGLNLLEKHGKILEKERAVKTKSILKPNKMTVKIEEYKAPSVLGDENRFFKGEYEKEKRSLFFS